MAFDPYYEWLGIPAEDQPPDHYQLLGIKQFEDNPNVIENAADRQMAFVRTFQTGPRSAHSQNLLNEIASAKICLLTPAKQEYDQQLRAQLEESQPAKPEAIIAIEAAIREYGFMTKLPNR